ncbi:MAG: hypothetical protein J6Y84_06365 [Bacteroidaceae bacterium]|nr:hypothetical protein [Bacteroidaceae bacterium]
MQASFCASSLTKTFTAIRNGVPVTTSFVSRAMSTSGYKLFELDEKTGEFSFDMREPATWIITIDDGSGQYDVNGDGSINVTDVTKLVDKILHP